MWVKSQDTSKQMDVPNLVSLSRLEEAPEHSGKQKEVSMSFTCDNPSSLSAEDVVQISWQERKLQGCVTQIFKLSGRMCHMTCKCCNVDAKKGENK